MVLYACCSVVPFYGLPLPPLRLEALRALDGGSGENDICTADTILSHGARDASTHHAFPIKDVNGNAPALLCSTSSRGPRGDSESG
jgi:hypothetical protein